MEEKPIFSENIINENKINENINNDNAIQRQEEKEKKEIKNFLKFKERPKNRNNTLIEKEKKAILKKYAENLGYKLPKDINILLDMKFNFGNQLLILNKLIFYCEIIGCKKILLEKDNNVFIKNKIYDKKYNLVIEVSDKMHENNFLNFNFEDNGEDNINQIDIDNNNIIENKDYYELTVLDSYFYYNTYYLRLENKYDIFKKEILKNLPKPKINKNDLFIHIRSGDIFLNSDPDFAPDYSQPPLCFYRKIIEENKFRKIYIISSDKNNPIIDILIQKYKNKNIIFNINPIEKDIAYLAFGYNIVGSISSFLVSIIKLNSNLKYFWEYNIYPASLGIPHLHHSLYNFTRNYTIFKMEPSKSYKKEMKIWECSKAQIKIMLNDACPKNFIIVKPNI